MLPMVPVACHEGGYHHDADAVDVDVGFDSDAALCHW